MVYQLYIANKNYSSWSMRPWVLLTACDIAFEEIMTPFAGTAVQHAFKAFSPTGKVPCLKDGDVLVWDSLAIVEYLAEAHPDVWPADRTARAWARSACAEMHSGFMVVATDRGAIVVTLPGWPGFAEGCTLLCYRHWPSG